MTQLFFSLVTVLGIGFLIFIHEAGHYLCARLAGVRVLVFSLGFGPRLLGFRRGHTDYRVAAVPLGGYVRVAGEDPTQRDLLTDDDLHSKGIGARALFYSGGVIMNLLFAVIAFPVVFRAGVEFTAPVVGEVRTGSPAWIAGMEPGERISAIDGKEMYSFENLQVEVALAGSRPIELVTELGGAPQRRTVQPRYDEDSGLYSIGISASSEPEIILAVPDTGPAHAAGLRSDDRLVSIDGEAATAKSVAAFELRNRYTPVPLTVEVERNGERVSASYTPATQSLDRPMLGVGPATRRIAGIRPGLGVVDALQLLPGDHILTVDGSRFAGGGFAAHATGPSVLRVGVLRDGAERELEAPVDASQRALLDQHIGLTIDTVGTAVAPQPGSPAEAAGLRDGEEILAIAGNAIGSWQELRDAMANAADSLALVVRGEDGERATTLTPTRSQVDLGMDFQVRTLREAYRKETLGAALNAGMVCSLDLIKSLYVTLKKLFTGEVAAKNLGGIITISRVTYVFAQTGWERFLYFLAMLSINLAFINVLPIPVLDGGHLLFVFIEAIKGSPVSPKVMNYSQILGLVFIVALLVFVTYNDILRLL